MSDTLEFTGERFVPECSGEIWLEHWHRYLFTAQFVSERRVLDIACGEGYGSDFFAKYATEVIGLDISQDVIVHAKGRYANRDNLQFAVASCSVLPFNDASFDIVISFETIEHIKEQTDMLAEFRRVLTKDGLLVISSPDKKTYSDDRQFQNEFHVRELYKDELSALLSEQFPIQSWFGQKMAFHSVIWSELESLESLQLFFGDEQYAGTSEAYPIKPMYFIVLCAMRADDLPRNRANFSLCSDQNESLFHRYENTVQHNIQLDRLVGYREKVILERDEMLEMRTEQLAERDHQIQFRDGLIQERDERLDSMNSQMGERDKIIAENSVQINQLTQIVKDQAGQIQIHASVSWWLRRPFGFLKAVIVRGTKWRKK